MAEVLIKLERASDESDLKAWTRGHPVAVQEDGWTWGALEGLPRFCVLHLTDVSADQVRDWLDPDYDGTIDDAPVLRAIRKWRLDMDDLNIPNWVKQSIKDTGRVSVTLAQIINFLKRTVA